MVVALFRLLGAVLQTMVVANTFGMLVMLLVCLFGGFVIPRRMFFCPTSYLASYCVKRRTTTVEVFVLFPMKVPV